MKKHNLFSSFDYLVDNLFTSKDKVEVKVFFVYRNKNVINKTLSIPKAKNKDEEYYLKEAKRLIRESTKDGSLNKYCKEYVERKKKKKVLAVVIPFASACALAGMSVGGYYIYREITKPVDHTGEKIDVEFPTIDGISFISDDDPKIGFDFDAKIIADTSKTRGLVLPTKLPSSTIRSGNEVLSNKKYTYTLDSALLSADLHIPGENVVGNIQLSPFSLAVPKGYEEVEVPSLPGTQFSNIVSKVGEEFATTITLDPTKTDGKALPRDLPEGTIMSDGYVLERNEYSYVVNEEQDSAELVIYAQSVTGPIDISFDLEFKGLAVSVVYELTEGTGNDTVGFRIQLDHDEPETITIDWGDGKVESMEVYYGDDFSHKYTGDVGDEFKISVYGNISYITFFDYGEQKHYESGNQFLTQVDIYKDIGDNDTDGDCRFGGYLDWDNHIAHFSTIEKITIHEGVTIIPYVCFECLDDLKEISLPSTLKTISEYAFEYSEIESITIPASVTSICDSSFTTMDAADFADFSCEYHGLREINIENTEDNPSLLERIEDDSFAYSAIESFAVPKSVKWIGGWSFESCYNLETFTFEEGSSLTYLGWYAFDYSSSITSISLPSSLCFDEPYEEDEKGVGQGIFRGWVSTQTVHVPFAEGFRPQSFHPDWNDYNEANFIYEGEPPTDCTVIHYSYDPDYTYIGFSFVAPEDSSEPVVVDWGNGSAPEEVTSPAYNSDDFTEDTEIKVYGPADQISLNDQWGLITDGNACVTEIEFGPSVTTIPDEAFYDVPLTTIDLSSNIVSVGYSAFAYGFACESLHIGENVESLGDTGEINCFSGLGEELTITSDNEKYTVTNNCLVDASENDLILAGSGTTVPTGTTTIEPGAFSGRGNIDNITIPNTVTSIGYCAFEYSYVKTVSFASGSPITVIPEAAFDGCEYLESIVLPANLEEIEGYAFTGCSLLSGEIVLPSTVTTIGEAVFMGCGSIGRIVLDESLESIGNFAFGASTQYIDVTKITDPSQVALGFDVFDFSSSQQILTQSDAATDAFKAAWSDYASLIFTKVNVTYNPNEITFDNPWVMAGKGARFSVTIYSPDGESHPSAVAVTIGGTPFTYFEYNPTYGWFSIDPSYVTGDIVIALPA